MKISFGSDCELPEGKVKFADSKMDVLIEKMQPKKITPYYVEFLQGHFEKGDVLIVRKDSILDLLILDMEKCETRLERSEDTGERALMKKCLDVLETEKPLSDAELSDKERNDLFAMGFLSIKPLLLIDGTEPVNDIIGSALEKAGIVFFYTAGPKEVHAWDVKRDSEIISCAGRIHSDLERGFIKGDVVHFADFIQHHSFNDCKNKGIARVVDRDYIVKDGDIIEIRFNV